jgi:hypothetical protein
MGRNHQSRVTNESITLKSQFLFTIINNTDRICKQAVIGTEHAGTSYLQLFQSVSSTMKTGTVIMRKNNINKYFQWLVHELYI